MIKFIFFQGKNAMSNATNEKHGCMQMMHGLSIAKFYAGHGVESI